MGSWDKSSRLAVEGPPSSMRWGSASICTEFWRIGVAKYLNVSWNSIPAY